MKALLILTGRYLAANKVKTTILIVCLSITIFLPLALHQLIALYETDMLSRADATPLVVGAKGDRYDLVLKSLYFNGDPPAPISMAEVREIRSQKRGLAIPLHLEFTARKFPVVGTNLEYFEFRGHQPASGTLPLRLGDCVIGSGIAEELNIGAGDSILTDQASLYNIGASYPLKMHVTGVLAESNTPDDRAVFTDMKTAWIIAGIGHGHVDLTEEQHQKLLLNRDDDNDSVTANASVVEYTEITADNIDSFHFHATPEQLPVTAIIAVPDSAKNSTLLRGRMSVSKTAQLLVPTEIVNELMAIVFRVKRFFDSSFLLVLVATILFLTLVVLLSLRLRKRERQTMFRIGCARGTVIRLHVAELTIILAASALVAWILTQILVSNAPLILRWLS